MCSSRKRPVAIALFPPFRGDSIAKEDALAYAVQVEMGKVLPTSVPGGTIWRREIFTVAREAAIALARAPVKSI